MRPYVDWRDKWLGKRTNIDGGAGYQCIDLFKQYANDVLGLKIGKSGNANQVWTNKYGIFDSTWTKIVGTNNLMQGDVIVSIKGRYGHIGVVDRFVNGKIVVLEQNGSGENSGSGKGENAIRLHEYNPIFWEGVRRNETIFNNLQLERKYIESKFKDNKDYENSIRYIK